MIKWVVKKVEKVTVERKRATNEDLFVDSFICYFD